MELPEQYRAAEALEEYLGDPGDPDSALSFARAVELDDRDGYPAEGVALLNDWKLGDYYVPVQHGGRLHSYEELAALLKVVARRDFTVALAHAVTLVGNSFVWLAGSEHQKAWLAGLTQQHGQIAAAFHEKAHGNDHLANEVAAIAMDGGYLLNGEKWGFSIPRRSTALAVFARTSPEAGPRGFSLFLVEKAKLDLPSYSYLSTLKSHGNRGHEIGGIRFKNARVPKDALIGSVGLGLEIALKSSQITRTEAPALALGAADTALRATVDFAVERRLYGEPVIAIPHARKVLVDAFLDLLICDSLLTAALRAIQAAPDQMAIASVIVKYFVPFTIEQTIQNLSIVLGARHYLREGHWGGIFQKLMRDVLFARLAHFPSINSLHQVALQLRDLARCRHTPALQAEMVGGLEAIYLMKQRLPDYDPARLTLSSRGRDYTVQSLELAVERLTAGSRGGGDRQVLDVVLRQTRELLHALVDLWTARAHLEQRCGGDYASSPELFDLAADYCTIHAAAACLHIWIFNRQHLGNFFAEGIWLVLCLDRLLQRLGRSGGSVPRNWPVRVEEELVARYRADRLFGLVPLQLARRGAR
jgi:alkylation response protein AidB-like acyl-CoA dehydrogenase